MSVIEVRDLVRRFGEFTAVDHVSFDVEEGELFGFLGPNGAGKTTTINMLCTLLRPTEGRAVVNGFDVAAHQAEVRSSIGLIFQDPTLDERLTGMQNLRFHAMLYDVDAPTFAARSAELLEMVELSDKAGASVKSYSGGMRRRLEIARGLLHHPKVLFLDEPTIGLDPQTRRHIWQYLDKVRASEGTTLFLTTHYMDEAEQCDRIAIIDHGRIIALDTPSNLKGVVGGDVITLNVSDRSRAEEVVHEQGLEPRSGPDGTVVVEAHGGDRLIPRLMAAFATADGVEVHGVTLARPTLEDVFIKLTGRAIREEEASAKDRMMHGMRFGPHRR